MNNITHQFPAQQLPYKQKGKTWRKQCVDFACNHTFWLVVLIENQQPINKLTIIY